ncbi:MAG: carboxylate--amine ligase [Candidatus Cloacimonadota bacterium]|nr:MAG: carboxylate--amine ligase [Candidatus Cloacimonadota bacterium]
MRVLVTDGSYSHTLSITRSLGMRGYEVYVLDTKRPSLCGVSRYSKGVFVTPPINEEKSFIDFLIHLLKKTRFDMLIPVGSRSVQIISKNKEIVERYTALEVPDFEKVRSAFNKIFAYALAGKIGIPYPKTVVPENIFEINKISENFHFPVVIKAREDTGSHLIDYVFKPSELEEKYKNFLKRYKVKDLPMVQQYIEGDGYGFFALYQNGRPKRIFMHHRIREFPPGGGASSCAESFFDPVLKNYGMKLLNALQWHGVAMVEFKKGNGDYSLMEINPKFWGSLDLAIASGVDFPYDLCQIGMGEELNYSEDFIKGLRFQWPFSDDFLHTVYRPISVPSYLKDFLSPQVKSNVLISDFKPNIIELKNSLFYLLRNVKRYLSHTYKNFF